MLGNTHGAGSGCKCMEFGEGMEFAEGVAGLGNRKKAGRQKRNLIYQYQGNGATVEVPDLCSRRA